jgi:iron complex outermembrane receptor protein
MRGVVIGALLASCVAPEVALAQADNQGRTPGVVAADTGGEIIVTAQKRAERLQDVPVAISVETQALLERQQVNTVIDLARLTPALEIQQGGTGSRVGGGGQIRGIGTISDNQGAAPAVGIVVDQVSQGTTNISDLFDVNRVEVLKGPQGTLFGLTTSAGVINIVTNKPDPSHLSARVLTQLTHAGTAGSGYGNQVVQGMLNVPVAPNAALRLTGNANLLQGVNRNTLTGKLDQHNSFGFRGRFLWEPTSALTVNLIGDYTKADARGHEFFTITQADPNYGGGARNPFNTAGALAKCGITANPANRDYCSAYPAQLHTKTFGGSAQIDYDAEPFTLTSITSYRRQITGPDIKDVFSIDPYPLHVLDGPARTRDGLFTQEFRAASHNGAQLEYTVGVFYSSSHQHNDPSPNDVLAFGNSVFPVPQKGVDIQINDESMAVFGQSTLHLGDHLRLIGGARYTKQKLSVDFRSLDSNSFLPPSSPPSSGRRVTDISNFSWKVGAQYEFSRDLQVYTTVSRGYKGPQIALGDPTADPQLIGSLPSIVNPEIPTSYEFGAKGNFLDNKLSLDLSVFYVKVVNYQTNLSKLSADNTSIIPVPANIPSVTSKGVELNITARPVAGLSFNIGGIYNPVKYPAGFLGEDKSDLTNAQLKFVPKYKITASGEYEQNLTARVKGFVSADLVYKSDLRLDVRNNSGPQFAIDDAVIFHAHATLGARIGLRADDDRWNIAIFARNLTNSHEPALVIPRIPPAFGPLKSTSVGTIFTPQSFRQVGISLDARF